MAVVATTGLSVAGGAGAHTAIESATACKRAPNQVQAVKANNVEAIIDDSYSMRNNDPDRLREAGLEQFITDPENANKVFGVVEFGTNADTVFGRAVIRKSRGAMLALLRSQIAADNGETNYDKGFIKGLQDNPAAEARIFLTDGAHDGVYLNSHRGGPRTFVVGLGIGKPGPNNPNANRLQQIANETGGAYFPNVAQATLQPTIRTIGAALNCLPTPRTFRSGIFRKKGQKSTRTVKIAKGTKKLDLVVNWTQRQSRFVLSDVRLLGKKKTLATLSGKGRPFKIRTKKRGGKTFRSISFKKRTGTVKLRFTIQAKKVAKPERTITQLTERVD
jgi:hypothetical protein